MELKNISKDRGIKDSLYIGRALKGKDWVQSPLANPFYLQWEWQRERVVGAYRRWLWQVISSGKTDAHAIAERFQVKFAYTWTPPEVEDVMWELEYLVKNDRDIACWCSPKLCHGHIVMKAVEYLRCNPEWFARHRHKEINNV